MGLSSLSSMLVSICILSTILKFQLAVANSLQSYTPSCSIDEHSALLQFKQSFGINNFMSASPFYDCPYPRTLSWKSNRSCCSWDGVECDEETGHVIGLDLSGSCLYGSINSSSSLFRLVHLESLNLAYNYFNYSQIPPTIRNFPRLKYLNFSQSFFSRQVPSEISQLSKLSSLDLSDNYGLFSHKGFLRSLAQNLTRLEKLHLSYLNISSAVPDTLTNSSLLTSLLLDQCSLFSEFPGKIFKLHSLKVLDLTYNPALTGYFPDDYNGSSPNLISLKLSYTNFSIDLPSLMERFHSLKELDVSSCNITGYFPNDYNGSIPNLISLKLSGTNFSIDLPSLMERFHSLKELGVGSCNISEGPALSSLGHLRDLVYLDLANNKLNGQIPAAALGNLTQLTYLSLYSNNFHGSIPESLFNLMNLQYLFLEKNNLSGTVELQKFLNLRNLTFLGLSDNNLELLTESRFLNNATTVLPSFEYLLLRGCNIREFPYFLRSQDSLIQLDLSGNKLQGQVPKWFLNISTHTLYEMNLSHNFLSGFDQPQTILPWVNILYLDLSFNMFHGSLWIPSTSIYQYAISNNNLTGQVPPLICNMTSLAYLDLSNNNLGGILPQCHGNFGYNLQYLNFGYNLQYLNLGNNSFHGNFPEAFTNEGQPRLVDISRNNFHGQLPRSLRNCASLASLVLSHNKFTDTFPVWLGDMPELKILMMDHNWFYGVITKPKRKNLHFPRLRILDLSSNNFTGQFPFDYIFSGNGTTSITHDLEYFTDSYSGTYYSITIISKGVERYYSKIQKNLILIDVSSNNFGGKIPEFIGKLSGIWSLNISNNNLTGSIPSSLSNLTRLESLDVSHNKLSGEIPQQLAKLDWLQKFNVSYNNLTGPIPRGNHFTTFDNTSYLGNLGLCGDILPKKCGDSKGATDQLPPSTSEEAGSTGSGIELDWKFVGAGLGSGLLVGVVLADFVITKWNVWFLEIVAVLIRLTRRVRRPRN